MPKHAKGKRERDGSKRSQVPNGFLRPRRPFGGKGGKLMGEKARETERGCEVERERT